MIFSFKANLEPEYKEGELVMEGGPSVISIEMDHCKALQDNGKGILVHTAVSTTKLVVPEEVRESFIEAWNVSKGGNIQKLWESEVGSSSFSFKTDGKEKK